MLVLAMHALTVAGLAAASAQPAWTVLEEGNLIVVHAPRAVAGSLLVVEVATEQHGPPPEVVWQGQVFTGHPVGDRWHVLLPVSLSTASRSHELVVRWGAEEVGSLVSVEEGRYPESQLRVDPKFAQPPPPRAVQEREIIRAALVRRTAERLWQEPFALPADGAVTSPFGARRTFNGKLESQHRGVDYDGRVGDEVRASNDGVVVLVADDFYYVGNAVFVDHGDGIVTAYFHLSNVHVRAGQAVRRGERLGAMGATGRSTGPHLHFGVEIDGSYVDPQSLLAYQPGLLLSELSTAR